MFERNRVDNSLQVTSVPAEVTLANGEALKGRFIISAARSVYDVLNGEAHFLDFETYGGERSLIAKATIASIKIVSVPGANGLKSRQRDGEAFDPYAVLGVSNGAAWDEVRRAYFALSKAYHPDRYAGVDLPGEVRDYLDAMARRINAAYSALEAPVTATKVAADTRAKPIFTSGVRL